MIANDPATTRQALKPPSGNADVAFASSIDRCSCGISSRCSGGLAARNHRLDHTREMKDRRNVKCYTDGFWSFRGAIQIRIFNCGLEWGMVVVSVMASGL